MAAFRVAARLGCTVEELNDRMTHIEFAQWCEYEAWVEQRTSKLDVYLARITAMLSAQLNPKKSCRVDEFILGGEKGLNLREMSSAEAKEFWRKAVPFAKYEELDNG